MTATLLELADYCDRNNISYDPNDTEKIIREKINEHTRLRRLEEVKTPPKSVFTSNGKEIEVKYYIPEGSRTFFAKNGKEYAKTMAVTTARLGNLEKGTEVCVMNCNLNDTMLPIYCNYPQMNTVIYSDGPLMVFSEWLLVYNGQSGTRIEN